MLDEKRIREIAQEVATANLTSANVSSVSSSAAVDSEGRDALRITIVIKPGSASRIKGDATLDTLVGIQGRLSRGRRRTFPNSGVRYEERAQRKWRFLILVIYLSRPTSSLLFRLDPRARWILDEQFRQLTMRRSTQPSLLLRISSLV